MASLTLCSSQVQESQFNPLESPDETSSVVSTIDAITAISHSIKDCSERLSDILTQVDNIEQMDEGHPLIDARSHTLLLHLINLLRFYKAKLKGESLEGSDIIKRLIKTKVILQHTRSLEEKLRANIGKLFLLGVQVDKDDEANKKEYDDLISMAINDPLVFKPNIDQLTNEQEDDKGQSINKDNQEIYKPPKIFGVELEDKRSKVNNRLEKYKKKVQQSRIISDLENEIYDVPEQVSTDGIFYKNSMSNLNKDIEIEKEREEYEIKHMTRLPVDRNEKRRRKRLSKGARAISINDELSAIEDDFKNIRRLRYTHNASATTPNNVLDDESFLLPVKKKLNDKSSMRPESNINLNELSKEAKTVFAQKRTETKKRLKRVKRMQKR